MKKFAAIATALLSVTVIAAQTETGHLSTEEINAAVAMKEGAGAVYIRDQGFATPSLCKAQLPGIYLYTPVGFVDALSHNAQRQFLKFTPSEEDTLRALTIISQGCANGTAAGPVCESITRVALLSDAQGTMVVEALTSRPVPQSWQNGFGARAVCSELVSKFPIGELQKIRNVKGEFLVATFNGTQLLKIYTVKEKFIKKLGL